VQTTLSHQFAISMFLGLKKNNVIYYDFPMTNAIVNSSNANYLHHFYTPSHLWHSFFIKWSP